MKLEKIVSAAGASVMAGLLALVLLVGLSPAQAYADEASSAKEAVLTIHVRENGSTSGSTGIEQVKEMLPKDAKPVGAGYVYSATKLNHKAMQSVINADKTAPNAKVTEKVISQLTEFIDKTNNKTTIYYGSTDSKGTITTKKSVEPGTWLVGATYDQKTNTLTGGSPATFPVDKTDNGDERCTYWLLQLIGAPKDKSATADAFIVQLPNLEDENPNYSVVVYPKVKVNSTPENPIQPTPPAKPQPDKPENGKKPGAAPIPADPNLPGKSDDPRRPANAAPISATPNGRGNGGAPAYTPSGRLSSTGSVIAGFAAFAVIFASLSLAFVYAAKKYGQAK